jgi:hypothetical protein
MLSFTDSSDIAKAAVYVDGTATTNYLSIGDLTKPTTVALNVAIGANTHTGFIVKAAASQSADIIQWKNSSGTTIGGVLSTGKVNSYSTTDAAPVEVVTLTDTQTLTRKTLTAPTINGGTVSSATSITLTGSQDNSSRARNITFSTAAPASDAVGTDGDVWIVYV